MSKRPEQGKLFPILMIAAGIILILGSVLWLINATQISQARVGSVSSPISSPKIPYPDIPRVSLGDAKAAYELKQATFIDVRGEPYYSQGHIPGALSISEDQLNSQVRGLDVNSWIITYCT